MKNNLREWAEINMNEIFEDNAEVDSLKDALLDQTKEWLKDSEGEEDV